MKKTFLYDLETFPKIFTATFIDKDSDDTRQFVISNTRDDREGLFSFLNQEVQELIGYNCLTFDAQILEYLYRNPDCTAENIRSYSQIITKDDHRFPDVAEWHLRIPHLDLFHALSLSVKAKRTSLKWCQYMMDLENIEDMPSQGGGDNWEDMVLSYNFNDVIATKELFQRNKFDIQLRSTMSKEEGISLMNKTEPGLAKALFSKYIAQEMGIPRSDLKSMGTDRDIVKIKDIIFDYVNFFSDKLQGIKKYFEKLEIGEYDKAEASITWQGVQVDFGLGGLHGAVKNKIVEAEDDIIMTVDVKSYYPNLAIVNQLCPEHLPSNVFVPLYRNIYEERTKIDKSDHRNYILKILLNSVYGMTNDQYSFLRDRQYTLTICINGQLLLAMLFEMLTSIKDSQLIMVNTDGCEIKIPKHEKENFLDICKQWEEITNLNLEYDQYEKLIIRDVNNYISVFTSGKTKCKGAFEFENIPLYKNKSHNIIPIATFNYFVKDIPIEETIKNHTNIFDFCAGVRAKKTSKKGQSWYELQYIDDDKLGSKKLSKTVRYFVSNHGHYLFKCYEDGSKAHVEAPIRHGSFKKNCKVTYFNKYYKAEIKDYDIDYSYYISRTREWIQALEDKAQLSLF